MIFSLTIVAAVLVYTWVVDPVAPNWITPIPVALVLALTIGRAIKTGEWGAAPKGFLPALWRAAAFTAAAALAISAAGSSLGPSFGTPHDRHEPWSSVALLIPWGLGQQFALQTVFLRESQSAVGRPAGICVAAALFAALHLPNPFLTAMTFAGALAWCWIYDRAPNLLPLALSHAMLTLAILYAFSDAVTGHLRVGASYLRLP